MDILWTALFVVCLGLILTIVGAYLTHSAKYHTLKSTYVVNGKRVSKEEWIAAGGEEIEEKLEETRKEMSKFFEDHKL